MEKNKCEHKIKENAEAGYVFCTECGMRWEKEDCFKHMHTHITWPPVQLREWDTQKIWASSFNA